MNRKKYFIWLLLFGVLISGCQREADYRSISVRRTVLVYLGVDNNFRAEAAQKIRQLTNAWHKDIDGNLLVYADTGEQAFLVHIYYSPQRGAVADTIETYAADNSASPSTLNRVLRSVKAFRPADSYGLVVLSHGTGWLPAEMSAPAIGLKSVIIDTSTDEPDNYMELSAFAEAIPYRLDFIIFDACWMASVEVAYELKDKADYLVASPAEVLEPGFVYGSMMRHLFKPKPDLTSVAREFYEYHDSQSDLFRSATASVIKTSAVEALAPIVKEITASRHGGLDPPSPDKEMLNQVQHDVAAIQSFGYGKQKIFFDLGDYLHKLEPEKTEQIQVALHQSVLYKAHTPSYYSSGTGRLETIRAFSGLTTYIPQEAYPEANKAYGNLKWAKAVY